VTECSLQEGHRKGLQEGLQKGRRQVATNFLKLGLSIEEIAKGTGLSPEQILQLK
jgi:predicted transposase/invertase (TIGR01784 family)